MLLLCSITNESIIWKTKLYLLKLPSKINNIIISWLAVIIIYFDAWNGRNLFLICMENDVISRNYHDVNL